VTMDETKTGQGARQKRDRKGTICFSTCC